jgi:hypothetical protein
MNHRTASGRTALRWLATAAGLAAISYGVLVAWSWTRYGRTRRGTAEESDPLLDQFMPVYDVVERHHVRIKAPADVTLAAAREMDLERSALVRLIFRTRGFFMGSGAARHVAPRGLLAQVRTLGWGVLAEVPGREIVMGAVTQPWKADVVFRSLPPDEFASFADPEHVKIVWSLRADPLGPGESVFRTETRAIATDAVARGLFRRYWAFVSPGVSLIRRLTLGPVKADAEQRASNLRIPLRSS